MSATDELRKLATHHRDEANGRRKKGLEYYRQARKAEQTGQKRATKEWQAMGDAELRVAASQQAEAERLTAMADVYDEMPDAP
jgi:hypothetical protein